MGNLLELKQVAIDTAENKVKGNFSSEDTSDAIRQAMIELFGTDKPTYKEFRRNKIEIFEFIEETITPVMHNRLEQTFYEFAEFKNINYGDENLFKVPDTNLFPVATIAEGAGDIRRKRLDSAEFSVEIGSIAAGIYEELVRFLAGRVDWAAYVQRLADSFAKDLALRISAALYGSFDELGDVYSASNAGDDAALKAQVLEIAAHVEAEYGEVTILGTKSALARLKPEYSSNEQDGERNRAGYFATVDGYDTLAIPQFHKNGTDEFAIDEKTILILPTLGEKIVKVVIEGNAIVREANGSEISREDMRVQYDVIQRVGTMVVAPRKYGMVKFS